MNPRPSDQKHYEIFKEGDRVIFNLKQQVDLATFIKYQGKIYELLNGKKATIHALSFFNYDLEFDCAPGIKFSVPYNQLIFQKIENEEIKDKLLSCGEIDYLQSMMSESYNEEKFKKEKEEKRLKELSSEIKEFSNLKGNIITEILINKPQDEIIFTLENGEKYKLYHEQDCCEGVSIEDICGDIDYLLNSEILTADEISSSSDDSDKSYTYTWTFYVLATIKGSVSIRWYGSSNGYYSESVDFEKC